MKTFELLFALLADPYGIDEKIVIECSESRFLMLKEECFNYAGIFKQHQLHVDEDKEFSLLYCGHNFHIINNKWKEQNS